MNENKKTVVCCKCNKADYATIETSDHLPNGWSYLVSSGASVGYICSECKTKMLKESINDESDYCGF